MSAQQFKQLLEKTIERANQRDPKEVATLAHLLIYCLQNNYRYQLCSENGNNTISRLIDELESEIKRRAIAPINSPENVLHHNYVLDEAVSNYEKFINKHSQQQKLTDNILIWLLKGDFNDNYLRYCRQACQKRGVDMPFLMPEFSGVKISELGFGTL